MKKVLFGWVSMILMGLASVGFTACGSDDDSDGGGSGNISASSLVGWAFEKSETSVGGNVEWVNWYIEFKNTNFAIVHMWGHGVDDIDGNYRWDYGEVDCMFKIAGSKVQIEYTNDMGTSTIVLNFVNGVPEGWSVSKRGTNPISYENGSSSGSSSGSAGTSSMFGYYSSDAFYNGINRNIKDMTSMGDYYIDNWKYLEDYSGYGYQIQDGSTINLMLERVEVNTTGVAPKASKGWTPVVYKNDSYFGRAGSKSVTIYVFFYYLQEPEKTLRYVVNGSTLELSNGTKLTYSGNTLELNAANTYTKR